MRLLDIHLGAGSNDPIEQVEKGRCDKKVSSSCLDLMSLVHSINQLHI